MCKASSVYERGVKYANNLNHTRKNDVKINILLSLDSDAMLLRLPLIIVPGSK